MKVSFAREALTDQPGAANYAVGIPNQTAVGLLGKHALGDRPNQNGIKSTGDYRENEGRQDGATQRTE
jgi:hypothetical protein